MTGTSQARDELNVGIVTPRYPPNTIGGGEISVQLLAGQLRDHERVSDVTVYSFDGEATERDKNGTPVVRLGPLPRTVELSNLYAYTKLRGRVTDHDVLHGYNMALHPTVGALSMKHDIPSVATLNSYAYLPRPVAGLEFSKSQRIRSKTTDRVARRYLGGIDTFVGLSQAIIDIYRSHGFSNEFRHVPNMLDPEFSTRSNATATDDTVEILFVGNLESWKGTRYLVEAMSLLPAKFRLRIVGDGPQREMLERRCRKLGVESRVEFSGSIPYEEVPAAYGRAGTFVHPGIWPEPFPRTMLEAMQSGLPVVCTDIGAPPEVLPDKDLVASPGDPESLAERIASVEGRRAEVGARNKRVVEERYTPSAVLPEMIALYDSLAGEQHT